MKILLGWIVFVMTACAPGPASPVAPSTAAPTEPAPLPDLIIKIMLLTMGGRLGNCVEAYSPYGISVVIENIGPAESGPFVVGLNEATQEVTAGLAPGQTIELHFPGTIPSGHYEARADADERVAEAREDNNSLEFQAPTPTPPLLCTPTPTPAP